MVVVKFVEGIRWRILISLIIAITITGCSNGELPDVATEESVPELGQLNEDQNLITTREAQDTTENRTDNAEEKEVKNKAIIKALIQEMTMEEKVGQLLMPAFRKWKGSNATAINQDMISAIQDYHVGGIILFQENIIERTQTKLLVENLQQQATVPLMIGIDQEGGQVTRLPFAPRMPGNMALGATGNPELAREVGIAIGSELRGLGIGLNFGPVLDINNNPNNPVIGVRSFGDRKENVAAMGMAYMQGLNDAGVAAVGKHFPGHGDVDLDSHYVLPKSEKTLEQLSKLELYPFQSLIDEGLQGIMSAHITFNQIGSEMITSQQDGLPIKLPATLSVPLLTDVLRHEMGFKGVLFSDAMDMKAITDHFGPVQAAVLAIEAGVDVILMPVNIELVYNGLVEAVKTGRISEERIDQSVERILILKSTYIFEQKSDHIQPLNMVVSEALEVEQKVANASVTVVQNEEMIPLNINEQEKIALVASDKHLLKSLESSVKTHHLRIEPILLGKFSNWSGNLTYAQKLRLKSVSKVIIVTNTGAGQKETDEWQMQLVQEVIDQNIPTIVIATRNPYDVVMIEGMEAFIAQFDSGLASFTASSDVIFGRIEATGKLPINLPE
jgi:beta-N-acetylhexosaminidase